MVHYYAEVPLSKPPIFQLEMNQLLRHKLKQMQELTENGKISIKRGGEVTPIKGLC